MFPSHWAHSRGENPPSASVSHGGWGPRHCIFTHPTPTNTGACFGTKV